MELKKVGDENARGREIETDKGRARGVTFFEGACLRYFISKISADLNDLEGSYEFFIFSTDSF